jgi:hypothetical protein
LLSNWSQCPVKKSLLVAATFLSAAAAAQAKELFLSIHSAASMAQGAGLVLATQVIEQKVPVRVLLCDAAGDIAVTGREMPSLKPRNVTPQQMLQGLIKAGDVAARLMKAGDVAARLMKAGVRTLAF